MDMQNKNNNEENTPWWNNLSQEQPDIPQSAPVADDAPYYDDYSPNKAKIIGIVVAIVCVIAIIGCGAAYGISMLESNKQDSTDAPKSIEEADTQPSDVYLTIYADGANEKTSPATITVLRGEEGDETVCANNVKVGERTKLSSLEGGKYRLRVGTVPSNEDGSSYLPPLFDMSFEVVGDGSDLDLTLNLDSEKNIEENKTETEAEAEAKKENSDTNSSNGSANSSSQSSNQAPQSSSGSSSQGGHQHSWTPITQNVHHDAVYRTVNHAAVKERVTICNTCGADITNNYSGHRNSTGHTSSHYETRIVKDAYSEQVLVSGAWDETVTTGYRCSGCGATR